MRIRTIKPEFWQDEDIGELPRDARLLFIATWNLADDEGLFPWTPAYIRSQVFAYDDLTIADVEALMASVEERGLVHPYMGANRKQYGWIVNFRKHQRIDKPQKPKYPLPSLQNPEVRETYARRDNWKCHMCGGAIERGETNDALRLSLDHLIPQSKGGGDEPSNIRPAHFGCNSSKGDGKVGDGSDRVRGIVDERSTGERKGKEQGREEERSSAKAEPSGSPTSEIIFGACLTYLKASVPEKQARSLLGKWRKNHGDDAVIAAVRTAEKQAVSEPVAYLEASLRGNTGPPIQDPIERRRELEAEWARQTGGSA